jgi:hypothetical protein
LGISHFSDHGVLSGATAELLLEKILFLHRTMPNLRRPPELYSKRNAVMPEWMPMKINFQLTAFSLLRKNYQPGIIARPEQILGDVPFTNGGCGEFLFNFTIRK